MKTFKLIQRIVAGAGLVAALNMVDTLQPSNKELIGGMALVVVCCLTFIGQVFYKEDNV